MLIPMLLALAPMIPQTTWYVDANVSGPGTGTLADPYSRIDFAVAQTSTVTGDTVLITPGSYLDEDIEVLGKGLRLSANGVGTVMIVGAGGFSQPGSGTSALIRVQGPSSGVTELIGLDFMDGAGEDDGTSVRGGAAFFQDSTVVIHDCSLDGIAQAGGGVFSKDTDLTVTNSSLRGLTDPPSPPTHSLTATAGGAILAEGGSVELVDCDVFGTSRQPYSGAHVRGESTAFIGCDSVTITRGAIRPGVGTSGQYYGVGGRIFAGNTTLRVDGTILANGGFSSSRGTGIAAIASDVHVTGVDFDMGQSLRIQGDGMWLSDCTTLVEGCTFRNCGGDDESDGMGADYAYFGGALYSSGLSLCTVRDSQFTDNEGSRGGAIYATNGLVDNCTFTGNSAFGSFNVSGQGGAIWLGAGTIQRCVFTGNFSSGAWAASPSRGFGGAVYAESATIDTCQFEGNQLNNHIMPFASQTAPEVDLRGGALYAAGPITLRNSTFNASAIVPRTFTFSPGSPQGMLGCGAYLAGGGTIEGCSFTGNGIGPGSFSSEAQWFGGGLYVEAGTVAISSSIFEANEAERGGGIYVEGGDVDLSLSVFRANTLRDLPESNISAERPAIAGIATLSRCTMVDHPLPIGSVGDVLIDGGEIDSSILVGNAGFSLPAALPVTYSIVEGGHLGLGNLNADPLFIDPFADVRLWPASPAIDAGNPALFDEGTTSRADMGAFPRQTMDCGSMCAEPLGGIFCNSNPNSTGRVGLTQAFGSDVAADEFLLVSATQLPLRVNGYFITSDTQGFVMNFGGSAGNLCLGMPLYRLSDQVLNSGTSGRVGRAVDTQALPQGQVVTAGSTWNFQFWHREAAGSGAPSNTTSAVSVTFL